MTRQTFEATFGPRTRFLLDLVCGFTIGLLTWAATILLFSL